MSQLKKYYLVVLVLQISSKSISQTDLNNQKTSYFSEYKSKSKDKIALELILGKWISNDTLQHKIEFVRNGQLVELLPIAFIYPYNFRIENDSVFVAGWFNHWPPYYCLISVTEENILEMKFSNYDQENSITRYYLKMYDEKQTIDNEPERPKKTSIMK